MKFSYNINFKQHVINKSEESACCVLEDLDKKLLNEVEEALEIKLSKFILNSVFEITNDNSDIKELGTTIKNLINAMLNKYNIDKENKYTMTLIKVSAYAKVKDNEDNTVVEFFLNDKLPDVLKPDVVIGTIVDVLYDIDILVKSK